MSDSEVEINEELDVPQDLADAVNGLMHADEEPELEASSDEPTEQHQDNDEEALSTDDEEEADTDYFAVDDSNSDTVFEHEGERATIRELFESHNNRTAPERLSAEREELASLRSELEARKEAQSYIDLEDKPHEFFQTVLEKMVGNGSLPVGTAESMIQAFRGSIQNGEYSVEATEQRASQVQKDREFQTREQQLADKELQVELRNEVVGLEAKYGKVTGDISNKIMTLIKDADKVGKQMTLTEAFGMAKTKGYFRKPPKTPRPKLADEFRSKGTKSDAPTVQESSMDDAMKAFYPS